MSQVKLTPIYGNWQMLSPDGVLMCRCDQRRAAWYLARGLADEVSPKVIRLKFKPAGNGNQGAKFLLEEKQNSCVVCGATEDLNRHHIVPYQYRRYMPIEHKAHASYDVIPICVEHHHEYEEHAQAFSKVLAIEYGVPLKQSIVHNEDTALLRKRCACAHALVKDIEQVRQLGFSSLPEHRKAELESFINDALPIITYDELKRFLAESRALLKPMLEGKPHGQLMIEHVLAHGSVHEFNKRWRLHFIETMKPKHLSSNWNVEYIKV